MKQSNWILCAIISLLCTYNVWGQSERKVPLNFTASGIENEGILNIRYYISEDDYNYRQIDLIDGKLELFFERKGGFLKMELEKNKLFRDKETWVNNRPCKKDKITIRPGYINLPLSGELASMSDKRIDIRCEAQTLKFKIIKLGDSEFAVGVKIGNNPIKRDIIKQKYTIHIEEEYWDDAQYVNTIANYTNYLNNYPDGQYVKQANDAIEKLYWESTVESKSENEIRKFLDTYPESHYRFDAYALLDKLNWELTQRQINSRSISNSDSLEFALDVHINSQELCIHEEEAKAQVDKLKQIEALAETASSEEFNEPEEPILSAEEISWNATNLNSVLSLRRHLERFPNSPFREEANSLIDRLIMEIRNKFQSEPVPANFERLDDKSFVIRMEQKKDAAFPIELTRMMVDPADRNLAVRFDIGEEDIEILDIDPSVITYKWRRNTFVATYLKFENELRIELGENQRFDVTIEELRSHPAITEVIRKSKRFILDASVPQLVVLTSNYDLENNVTFQAEGGQKPYILQVMQGDEHVFEKVLDSTLTQFSVAANEFPPDLDGIYQLVLTDSRRNERKAFKEPITFEIKKALVQAWHIEAGVFLILLGFLLYRTTVVRRYYAT